MITDTIVNDIGIGIIIGLLAAFFGAGLFMVESFFDYRNWMRGFQ